MTPSETAGLITIGYAVCCFALWGIAWLCCRRERWTATWALVGVGWMVFFVGWATALAVRHG